MDIEQLASELKALKIDSTSYYIYGTGDPKSDAFYVIRYCRAGVIGNPNYWTTYFFERGSETNLRKFFSEDEACRSFLEQLTGSNSQEFHD